MNNEVSTGRPRKYKTYKKENLESAVRAVTAGEFSQMRAAIVFGVPRNTLRDRLKTHKAE